VGAGIRDDENTAACAGRGADIRWQCNPPAVQGGAMPEFTTVSVQEAQLRTIPGRQGQVINEFADFINPVPQGQAGKLSIGENEKHTVIRRRLATTAKAMNINLIIKRSGNDPYFWREDGREAQPRARRGRRPRNGRPGSLVPAPTGFSAPETGEQGAEATPLDQAFTDVE
jgi:hypothetical protein